MNKKAITLVEIDIEVCQLNFGATNGFGTCTAVLGPEGKCFNTRKTTQSLPDFNPTFETLRFAIDTDYLPIEFDAIPCIDNVSFSPATISLGENLGQRTNLTITFKDAKHSDAGLGFDPYYNERPYNPYNQGTLWGKFRARQPFLKGKDIRLLRGFLGQNINEFRTWNFIIDSFDGPNPQGIFTIIAKDILKLSSGITAQAPQITDGFLSSNISAGASNFTISPVGIGNEQYPSFGFANIGGSEIVQFTRSNDSFSINRGAFNTNAVSHDVNARVQLCLNYVAGDPGDIIRDLFVNYANIDSSFINIVKWNAETDEFLSNVYTTLIAEPTSVNKLISELIEQAALSIWWDALTQEIELRVLREINTDAFTFTQENINEGTIVTKDQSNLRISQVLTYFAQKNPLKNLDDLDNYRSIGYNIDFEAETEYGVSSIKKIFSRWIPQGGSTIVDKLNQIVISRFRDPPRKVNFKLFSGIDIELGKGYNLRNYNIQDAKGNEILMPIQVTRLSEGPSGFDVQAEEMLFKGIEFDPNDHQIVIGSNSFNVNLRTLHDTLYSPADSNTIITLVITNGTTIGSTNFSAPALDIGSWGDYSEIIIILLGRIQGKGGNASPNFGGTDQAGGTALLVNEIITIDFLATDGEIWGGGGAGKGIAVAQFPFYLVGGGGAGTSPGTGNQSGTDLVGGSGQTDGVGNFAGDGGDAGEQGGKAVVGPFGGAAGKAVDGDSFITYVNDGSADIRGPQTG